jgi:hypothetical protein
MRAAFVLFAFGAAGLAETPKLPGHVKLSQGYSLPSQPASNTKTVTPPVTPRKAPLVADGRCAHIIVHKVSPDIDPKIIIESPATAGAGSRMPLFKGVPACPEDVR